MTVLSNKNQQDKKCISLPLVGIFYFIFTTIILGNNSVFTQFGKILLVGITFTCILYSKGHHPKTSKIFIIWNFITWGYFAATYYWSSFPKSTASMSITFGYVCLCCSCLYYLITFSPCLLYTYPRPRD